MPARGKLPESANNNNIYKNLGPHDPASIPRYESPGAVQHEAIWTGEEVLNLRTRRTDTEGVALDLGNNNRTGALTLCSLTDDMFVLEEPSFVLPYLYERRPPLHLPHILRELRERADFAIPVKSIPEDINSKIFPRDHLPADYLADGTGAPDFASPLGIFFIGIGLNLVQEAICRDLMQLHSTPISGSTGHKRKRSPSEDSVLLTALRENQKTYELVNSLYKFDQKRCALCEFQTESSLALEHHLENPHTQRGLLRCNFCPFSCRKALQMIQHCQRTHGVVVRLTCVPPPLDCELCPFSCSTQRRLVTHIPRCQKTFQPGTHLAPEADWELPAKIPQLRSGQTNTKKARSSVLYQPVMSLSSEVTLVATPDLSPDASKVRPELTQTVLDLSSPTGLARKKPSVHVDTPKPKLIEVKYVVCEVCSGYLRDLTQLKNHMQIAHSITVKERLFSRHRPPINCQKCDSRFFVWQGLERHLLGVHGMVSEAWRAAADRGNDGGRCILCGKGLFAGLVEHMVREHRLQLRPARVLYNCPLCCHTFDQHPLYEAHISSQHSGTHK